MLPIQKLLPSFFFLLLLSSLSAQSAPTFEEQGGIVVIETESAATYGQWRLDTTIAGYTGTGSLRYTGPDRFNLPGNSLMFYKINITTTGKYRFQWHSRIAVGTSNTEHNDTWLRFDDASAFYAQKGSSIIYPRGSGMSPNPEGSSSENWFKVYQNRRNDWSWNANTNDNDPYFIFVEFDTAGVYTLEVSGRSNGHSVNRMVLYHSSANSAAALSLSRPESPRVEPNSVAVRVDASSLKLYPNPAEESLKVDVPTRLASGGYVVSFWDAAGRMLRHNKLEVVPGQTLNLSVSGLKTGNYLLQFEREGKVYSGRFIKR